MNNRNIIQNLGLAGNAQNQFGCQLVFLLNLLEYAITNRLFLNHVGIFLRNQQICLGQGHLQVVDKRAEERILRIHRAQRIQLAFVFANIFLQRRSCCIPCRQQITALRPCEYPRNSTQIFKSIAVLPLRWTRTDVKLANLRQRR
ncbi:hypothetical protein D3C77_605280 [compost metagenome]